MLSDPLHIPSGQRLIEEGVPMGRIYVLRKGAFEVIRGGVRVITINEPGAFMGEISALLGVPPTADVIATQDSEVDVIEDAAAAATNDPRLTYAVAQLLARRLHAVTAYLVDLKQQYAGSGTHLGLMDQVLASLMSQQQPTHVGGRAGSERTDVPDY